MRFFFWTKYPFVQVGFAFIGGDALAYTFTNLPDFELNPYNNNCLSAVALLTGFAILCLLLYHYKKRVKVNGFLLCVTFFLLGSIRFLTYDERSQAQHLQSLDRSKVSAVAGQVITEPEHKKNNTLFYLRLHQVKLAGLWMACRGTLKVTLADTVNNLSFHASVIVKGKPLKPLAADTPYDFNYARFLAHQNIHYTLYSKTQPVAVNRTSTVIYSLQYYAIQARQKLEDLLVKKIKHQRAYALVNGLLIGKRSDLDQEDKLLFTNSGTIHVLAVSGMHVVLIYQSISFLALLFRIRQQRVVFNLAVLVLIWFYIFITGLQASASRAAIMITLVLVGKLMQRDNQNINSLFATAFLMLLYNPYYLADAGFILSFLAVAGILIFSGLSIKEGVNKLWTYLLNASLISCAAQAATFPYSVYLFHQFPVYFLLANLIVVPLTSLLLFLAVLLLLVYHIPCLNEWTILLIEWFTDFLFYILNLINYLPWPTISHISFSAWEMSLLYACLLMTILLFVQRKASWLWGMAASLMLLCGSLQYRMIWEFHHPAILISGKKDNRQYVVSAGHEALILTDHTDAGNTPETALFLTHHFALHCRTVMLTHQTSFILQHRGKDVGIIRNSFSKIPLNTKKLQNCGTLILDYTIKYSYLDQKKIIGLPHQKIFSLYGKKSFYSITNTL